MAERVVNMVTVSELKDALDDVRGRLAGVGAAVEFLAPTMGTDSTGERTVGVVAIVADNLAGRPSAAEFMLDILDEMRRVFNERGIAVWPFVNIVRRSDVHELDEAAQA